MGKMIKKYKMTSQMIRMMKWMINDAKMGNKDQYERKIKKNKTISE